MENLGAQKNVEYWTIVRPESPGEAVTGKAHMVVECDDHISEMDMLTYNKDNETPDFDVIGENIRLLLAILQSTLCCRKLLEKTINRYNQRSMPHFSIAQTVLN